MSAIVTIDDACRQALYRLAEGRLAAARRTLNEAKADVRCPLQRIAYLRLQVAQAKQSYDALLLGRL